MEKLYARGLQIQRRSKFMLNELLHYAKKVNKLFETILLDQKHV